MHGTFSRRLGPAGSENDTFNIETNRKTRANGFMTVRSNVETNLLKIFVEILLV